MRNACAKSNNDETTTATTNKRGTNNNNAQHRVRGRYPTTQQKREHMQGTGCGHHRIPRENAMQTQTLQASQFAPQTCNERSLDCCDQCLLTSDRCFSSCHHRLQESQNVTRNVTQKLQESQNVMRNVTQKMEGWFPPLTGREPGSLHLRPFYYHA